jgi:hypothetical protein
MFRFVKTGSAQHLQSAIIGTFLTGKARDLQLLNKTLSMATQKEVVWATDRLFKMQMLPEFRLLFFAFTLKQ